MSATLPYKIGNEKLVRVSEAAAAKVRSLLERQGRPGGALRVAVLGGGCSGLQYKMDLVDGPVARDILVTSGGVNVVVRAMPAARPLAETTRAILRLASSIISSPSITAPRAPPAADV